jgi:hypothetical protein
MRYGGSGFAGVSWWDVVDYELTPYPLRSMCRDFYQGMYCFGYASLTSYYGCNTVVATGPVGPVPGQPSDTGSVVPNEGVVKGGLFTPTPVPIPVNGSDPPPVERISGRFDQPQGVASDLDNVLSIPARATRKMKEDDAHREKATAESPARTRTGFDRAEAAKPQKDRVADADAVTRIQPPAREPTKAKNTGDTNRDTRSKSGFGSTDRRSEPRSSGADRVSRPADTKSTGTSSGSSGGSTSIQGTTTTKTKPPQN